jgi:hypothetical protein
VCLGLPLGLPCVPSNGSWKIRTPKNPHSFPLAVLVKTNWEDWVNSKLPVA